MVRVPAHEILVIGFGGVKALVAFDRYDDWPDEIFALADLRQVGGRDLTLRCVERDDRGAILSTRIRSLTILQGRISNHRKQDAEQAAVADLRRVINDPHRLGMARFAVVGQFIFRGRGTAAMIARFDR